MVLPGLGLLIITSNLVLKWWYSTGANLLPQGTFAMSGNIFGCHPSNLGSETTGICWIEAGDAAEYPTVRRTTPAIIYPAQNVSSADIMFF